MKSSIPSISFFQDGSVHHLYVSDRTILVHPNAEPLNNCGHIIVFSAIRLIVAALCCCETFLSYLLTKTCVIVLAVPCLIWAEGSLS